jgi:AcrR family transcriptional regulator
MPPVPPPSSAQAAAERAQLMDAALKVMRCNGFQGASVQDILDEAELSTRAFYRQFRSKDDLLLAMFRTASARDVAAVRKRVAEAVSPLAALHAWIDEMLAIAFDRRRIQRLVMFSAVARQTAGYDEEVAYMRNQLVRPLRLALEDAAAQGSTATVDAALAARAVFDLVWSTVSPQSRLEHPVQPVEAKELILRFCVPALDLPAAWTAAPPRLGLNT